MGLGGILLALIAEFGHRHFGGSSTAFLLSALSHVARHFNLTKALAFTMSATTAATVWWAVAHLQARRRPSIFFCTGAALQLLGFLRLWNPGATVADGAVALPRSVCGEPSLHWGRWRGCGSSPEARLLEVGPAGRIAAGYLQRRQLPVRLLGLALILSAGGLLFYSTLPLFKVLPNVPVLPRHKIYVLWLSSRCHVPDWESHVATVVARSIKTAQR